MWKSEDAYWNQNVSGYLRKRIKRLTYNFKMNRMSEN